MHIQLPLQSSITMRRNDAQLPLARVTATPGAILVEYGHLVAPRCFFVREVECLPLSSHPDFADLYREGVWDIDKLHALISPAISEDTFAKDNQE